METEGIKGLKQYILSGKQSKFIDEYCIQSMGIPSVVLMERAALAVAGLIDKKCHAEAGILAVCHVGNNGADGLAAARILDDMGYQVTVLIVGRPEKGTEEFRIQLEILKHTDIRIEYGDEKISEFDGYAVIIDGIFGIGLSREVQGLYADIIEKINRSESTVVSIDIPSGLNTDTGQPMGTAVMADYTVTFGNLKLGHKISKGRDYCGEIYTSDIGFRKEAYQQIFRQESLRYTFLSDKDCDSFGFCTTENPGLPKRMQASNKGTYGKVAVIAGFGGMSGAAYFSAKAAYLCGSGLVKVISAKETTNILKSMLPEAIYADIDGKKDIGSGIRELVSDCRAVVIGPGLGQGEAACEAVKAVLELELPTVMDADALNILGSHRNLSEHLRENIIVTPHVLELSRMTGISRTEITVDIVAAAEDFAGTHDCICILKDSSTVVSSMAGDRLQTYINITGNSGMAAGGSGDVLSGILGGLLAQQTVCREAAELGVYIHGMAGDLAAEVKTEYGVMASDILNAIPEAISRLI